MKPRFCQISFVFVTKTNTTQNSSKNKLCWKSIHYLSLLQTRSLLLTLEYLGVKLKIQGENPSKLRYDSIFSKEGLGNLIFVLWILVQKQSKLDWFRNAKKSRRRQSEWLFWQSRMVNVANVGHVRTYDQDTFAALIEISGIN